MKKISVIILLSFLFGCCDSYLRFESGRYYVNWCKCSYCIEKDTGIDCYDKKYDFVTTLIR